MAKILVVDDDRTILHLVGQALSDVGVDVLTASTAADAIKAVREEQPDVLLLDIVLPETSGLEAFRQIRQIDPKLPVIFITGEGNSEVAIEAMQLGAYDYVPKPLDLPRLSELVGLALKSRRLMQVPVAVEAAPTESSTGDLFIGSSPEMVEVFKSIGRVSAQDITVLIRGESGTGKELVARAVYQHGPRSAKPFIAVNCAALPDTLLESELFGHEKGAFTGADRRRIGKFEQCDGGTMFLDEVGDMSPLLQSKVLRLLQEQKFERVGGNKTIETNVRIIAATNRDLETMVEDDSFRSDLYYRLNGVTISLPPLRERGEDIARLLQFYLGRSCRQMNKTAIEGISLAVIKLLNEYHWPGNVRELQSLVNQMVLNVTGSVITPECLPDEVRRRNGHRASPDNRPENGPMADLQTFVIDRLAAGSTAVYAETLEMMEKFVITRVLNETGGNQSKAAERLGITRGKLRDRISTYGISVERIVGLADKD